MKTSRIMAVLLLLPAFIFAAATDRYIIQTSNPSALKEFASEHGIEVSPFITYPNPSQETMQMFADHYVIETSEPSGFDGVLSRIEELAGFTSSRPDRIIQVIPPQEEWSTDIMRSPDTSFDEPYLPDDPLFSEQWDKPITGTDWGWNLTRGEGETVAVLDQGVDTTHEDLVENLYMGWDFNEDDADYYDIGGHGTQCCGVACARIDNGKGLAGTSGAAQVMALKIFGSQPTYTSTISNAINYAIDNGARVISMSWGNYGDVGLSWTVNNAWERGAFMCAGAANDNSTDEFYPAAYDKVMAVGATNQADQRWANSNYGDWVQIFAPGGRSTRLGGGYGGVQATSFTTPQIAGLAALVWSAYPYATNRQVWDHILATADTIESDVGPILRMNTKQALFKSIEPAGVAESKFHPQIHAANIQAGAIRFNIPANIPYDLRIYDVTGREVHSRSELSARSEISLDAPLESGVYFWTVKTSAGSESGKLVYVR